MERNPRLKVLALVPYPMDRAPGQRYRIEQWTPHLHREGIDISFLPFAGRDLAALLYQSGRVGRKARGILRCLVRRIEHVWSTRSFDVVFLYREASLIGPAWLERLAAIRNPRIVYDFDDAVWVPYVSPRNRYLSYLKAPGKTASICRMARSITVGNDHLAAYARRYNPSVTVVPSTVSLDTYRPRPSGEARSTPVIGWTGSHSSAQYLRLIERPLQRLAKRRRFRFVVIGVDDVRIPGVDVECRAWRAQTEGQDLWDLDVGVMPLPDDPWTRGKCAMKAIQYLAVGTPAVVSPVGANRDVVRHGEDGFHAVSVNDWLTSLESLLLDPGLRQRLGGNGRLSVERKYCAEVQAPRMARVLKEASS